MQFELMKDFMDGLTNWRIPGNSISVYKDGEEVFTYSSGFSDVEQKTKMQGDELFNIYSCSKVATVVAALQLYEKGLFLLDNPLYDFIPEFREMNVITPEGELKKAEKAITLRHLFTMTAGLTYNLESEGIMKAKKDNKTDTLSVAKYIATDPLAFEPGERWNYSLCHDVLAAVVEVVSGKRFSTYVKENIFDLVDAKDVYYHRTPEIIDRMGKHYSYETEECVKNIVDAQINSGSKDGVWVEIDKDSPSALGFIMSDKYDSGGAGIVTSIRDYAKFCGTLANAGICKKTEEKILSPKTIDLLRTNQLSKKQIQSFNWEQLKGYGYGLGVRTMMNRAQSGSNGSVGEFGWGGAAGATVMVDVERNFAYFYAHHMLNPQEEYYQPRLRNVAFTCLDS